MPLIVSYRFLGWVTALKSKCRAHEKEESRLAALHFDQGDVETENICHRKEMEAWKERCKWVGIAKFCFNLQKARRTQKEATDLVTNDGPRRSPTPPPSWSEECPEFGSSWIDD
ncbi:unnamed protein product [Allacma fusca]|uniref:Uncharacterized protein n=1 Tax=Allacma fusca TaxID=39272 RepID=A0A8J2LAA8_9HEXA|nr:unnamed protein product [Allacma fusca]